MIPENINTHPKECYYKFQGEEVLIQRPDFYMNLSVDHIRVLGTGLELTCNGGWCGGISLKKDGFRSKFEQ